MLECGVPASNEVTIGALWVSDPLPTPPPGHPNSSLKMERLTSGAPKAPGHTSGSRAVGHALRDLRH